jgi:hypothetical protein
MYEYFKGEFDALPEFNSLTPHGRGIVNDLSVTPTSELISFDTNLSGAPSKESGNFALRFSCLLKIPTAGVWTFYLLSNDGSALYLSGKKIVSNDGSHYAIEKEGKLRIREPGFYPLTVLYFHKNGKMLEGVRTGPCLSFSYYFAGTGWLPYPADHVSKQTVPASSYFYNLNDEKTRLFLSSVSEAEECNYKLELSYEQSLEAELQDLSTKVYDFVINFSFTLQKTLQDFYQRFDKLFKRASEQPLTRISDNLTQTTDSDRALEDSLETKFAYVEKHLAGIQKLQCSYFFMLGLQVKLEENVSSVKIQVPRILLIIGSI